MSENFVSVDLVRLSKTALPIARSFDVDGNKTLDETEYKEFEKEWEKDHSGESPLLMQLHMNTLNEDALEIAKKNDVDDIKGVLTETELLNFIEQCEEEGIKNPFKKDTMLETVLTGNEVTPIEDGGVFQPDDSLLGHPIDVFKTLNKNLKKLLASNWMGIDKYFHAIGNFEAMMVGSEGNVKRICSLEDLHKYVTSDRTPEDRSEDLYANWLGREFAKMYPNQDPHDLFAPLAPTGFDTDAVKNNSKNKNK